MRFTLKNKNLPRYDLIQLKNLKVHRVNYFYFLLCKLQVLLGIALLMLLGVSAEEKAKEEKKPVEAEASKRQDKRGLYEFGGHDFGGGHDFAQSYSHQEVAHHEPHYEPHHHHHHEEKTLTVVKKIGVPVPVEKIVHVPEYKEVHVPYHVNVPQPYPVVKHVSKSLV